MTLARTLGASLALAALVAASVPGLAGPFSFSYGGRIADDQDRGIAGPVALELRFWTAPSGGSDLLGRALSFANVTLDDGVFEVDAGTGQLAAADLQKAFGTSGDTWVEVRDVTHNVTYPRQRLAAVPYALKVPVDSKTITYDQNGNLTLVAGAPAAGQVLTADATGNLAWAVPPPQGGGGSLTSVIAGSGLVVTGGSAAITTTGTLNVNVGTGANQIVQIGSDGKLPAVDGSRLTGLATGGGSVTAVGVTAPLAVATATTTPQLSMTQATGASSGYLAATDWLSFNGSAATVTAATSASTPSTLVKRDASGAFTVNGLASTGGVTLVGNGTNATTLRLDDKGGANFLGLKAPDTLAGSLTWVLPASDGSGGQVLKTDGSGNLGWASGVAPSGAAGGDLSGTFPNPTLASGVVTAAKLAAGTIVDSNISASAAIAASKIAGLGTAAPLNVGTGSLNVVQLMAGGLLPAVNGSLLTSLSPNNFGAGTVPVASGGTNSAAALTNNQLMVSAAGKIVEGGALGDGQLLIGYAGSAPAVASLTQTGTQGVTIVNGHGSIKLDTAQDIRPSASPSFSGLMVAGPVGVGTTSPVGALDVRGGTSPTGSGAGINLFAQNAFTTGNYDGGNITLMPGIANGTGLPGMVGVNTSSPGAVLFVEHSGTSMPAFRVHGGMFPGLTVADNGNVGMNTPPTGFDLTSPSLYLNSNAFLAFQNPGGTFSYGLMGSSSMDAWAFGAGNNSTVMSSKAMVWTASGQVGIGTTAPQGTLHVNGTLAMKSQLINLGSSVCTGQTIASGYSVATFFGAPTGGTVTMTLPACTNGTNAGQTLMVTNAVSGTCTMSFPGGSLGTGVKAGLPTAGNSRMLTCNTDGLWY